MNRRRLVIPFLAWAALSCSDLSPEAADLRRDLAANRARWEALGLETYVYEVEHSCFCPVEAIGPVRVQVENGSVTSRTYPQSGDSVAATFSDVFPTVDGLFDVLQRAIDQNAADVQVTWDPDTGVPLHFSIDYIANAVDEEEGYRIVDGPRTTP